MNGTDDWFCNNCDFEIDENSYDGNGLIIRNREYGWAGTGYEILIKLTRSDKFCFTSKFEFRTCKRSHSEIRSKSVETGITDHFERR